MMVVTLLAGAALTALSVWSWRGRSQAARWWTRQRGGIEELALGVLPGVGLVSLGAGLEDVFHASWLGVTLLVCGTLVLVWGVLVTFVATFWWPAQRAWGPRWFARRRSRDEAGGTARRPDWLGTTRARWRGGLVVDPDAHECPDALGRRGTVTGQLHAGEGGLWFAPVGGLDAGWQRRARVRLPWAEVREAHTVPSRAGADGTPRAGRLRRSWFRRVVVVAESGSYLFEIDRGRAETVTTFLQQQGGVAVDARERDADGEELAARGEERSGVEG